MLSVDLKNYRQYRGEQSIKFGASEKKNFTIIQGPNGSGKTNLLNAITWCLYGTEPHLSGISKEKSLGPMNLTALKQLGPNKTLDMWVRIELGESRSEYQITRFLRAYKRPDGEVIFSSPPENPKVIYLEGRDWKVHTQPAYLISYLLPEAISGFFFFDGEHLDDFFKAESRKLVERALLDVSQINLMIKANGRLEDVRNQIQRDARGLSPQAGIILGQITAYKESLSEIQKSLDEFEQQASETIGRIREIDAHLKEIPREGVTNLQGEREVLASDIDELDEDRKFEEEKIMDLIISVGPCIYGIEALNKTIGEIEKKYRSGELPPKIREQYVNDLLKSGKCICGTDISKRGPHQASVRRHLQVALFSQIDEEIREGKFELGNLKKPVQRFANDADELGKRISKQKDEIRRKQERLKEISTILAKYDVDEIQRLEGDRIQLDKLRDDLNKKIGSIETQIENTTSTISSRENDYKKELRKSEKHSILRQKIDLCEKATLTLDTIRQELIDETRKTIERKTKEYFLNLIWKKETFVDVKIDENYSVSVLHKGGWDALATLSAGERQVLALSFMAALKEVSGFDVPVIIDTPLGRISKQPKDNIAECLPKYLARTQVVMLMTDQEYTDSVRSRMMSRIGEELQLTYDEQADETRVSPYTS